MSQSTRSGPTRGIHPLTRLRRGERAQIVRIDGHEASELAGFGISNGTELQVIQRFPTYIVQTDEAEVAIEPAVAAKIFVSRLK